MSLHASPRAVLSRFRALNVGDRNTLVFVLLVFATGPALGEWSLTAGVSVAFAWALLSVLRGSRELRLDRSSVVAAISMGIYASVKVVFTIAHSGFAGLHTLQGFILFLAPIFLISYLHRNSSRLILDSFVLGCGFSALLAFPIAAYQVFGMGIRAEGGCGNAGVFAVITLVLGSIGSLNVASSDHVRRALGFIAWIAMVFCVLASGMRGIWIAIPVTTGIVIWAAVPWIPKGILRRGLLAAVAVSVIGLGLASESLWKRAALIGTDVARIEEAGDYSSSTGRRILMYTGAWKAIRNAPFTGYGIYERMNAVTAHLPERMHNLVNYSHPHNGFLAAMLDAGIAGLAALILLLASPIWIAAAAPPDETWRLRMAAALILFVSYVASGMTNILFEHDLMDTAFIAILVVVAVSVPRQSGQSDATEFLH